MNGYINTFQMAKNVNFLLIIHSLILAKSHMCNEATYSVKSQEPRNEGIERKYK